MAQEITNFAWFYALFNRLSHDGDWEELGKSIVLQYTRNRTDSPREMTRKEYGVCRSALEKLVGQDEWHQKMRAELRYRRSIRPNLMWKLGIDTSDWARINDSCRHPRIAGKPSVRIIMEEPEQLVVELRGIQRKGGLKLKKVTETVSRSEVGHMSADSSPNKAGEA